MASSIEEAWREVCRLGHLPAEFSHMGVPPARSRGNLEAFATKVMPRFTDAG